MNEEHPHGLSQLLSTLWKKEHWGPWLKFKTCEMTYVHRQNSALRLKILLLAGSMWYKYGLYTGMVQAQRKANILGIQNFFFKGYRIYLIKNNVPDLGIFLNHYNLGKKIYQSMIDTQHLYSFIEERFRVISNLNYQFCFNGSAHVFQGEVGLTSVPILVSSQCY